MVVGSTHDYWSTVEVHSTTEPFAVQFTIATVQYIPRVESVLQYFNGSVAFIFEINKDSIFVNKN